MNEDWHDYHDRHGHPVPSWLPVALVLAVAQSGAIGLAILLLT